MKSVSSNKFQENECIYETTSLRLGCSESQLNKNDPPAARVLWTNRGREDTYHLKRIFLFFRWVEFFHD
jgi:hypothetical protein